jgi:hypothetical protein
MRSSSISSTTSSASSVQLIPLGPAEFYTPLVPDQAPHEQGPVFGPAPETNRERGARYVKVVDETTDEIALGIALGILLGPDISLILDIIDIASEKDLKDVSERARTAGCVSTWTRRAGAAGVGTAFKGRHSGRGLTSRRASSSPRHRRSCKSTLSARRRRGPWWRTSRRSWRMLSGPSLQTCRSRNSG